MTRCPGTRCGSLSVGHLYVGTADSIDRAVTNLSTALSDGFGQAQAIDAIREQAEDVARRIGRAEERYRGVGEAMVAYAAALAAAQSDSAAALARAEGAQSAASTAEWNVGFYEDRVRDPATPPANLAAAQESLHRWVEEQGDARSTLSTARADVEGAVGRRDAAAGIAIDAVRLVESTGDLNDGFWDDVSQWVAEHKEILDTIGDVLGIIAMIATAILLVIPGLNAVVLMIITVVLLVNLAYSILNGALQASTGNMSVAEAIVGVGMAALNFVGAGLAVRAATTASRTAVTVALRGGVAGMTRRASTTIVDNLVRGAQPWWFSRQTHVLWQALDLNPKLWAPLAALSRYAVNGAPVAEAVSSARTAYGVVLGIQAVDLFGSDPLEDVLEPHLPAIPWRVYGDDPLPSFGKW